MFKNLFIFCRIYTEPNGNRLKLIISEIQSIDTGTYNCTGRVTNIPSSWSFELQAFGKLAIVSFKHYLKFFQLKQNLSVTS